MPEADSIVTPSASTTNTPTVKPTRPPYTRTARPNSDIVAAVWRQTGGGAQNNAGSSTSSTITSNNKPKTSTSTTTTTVPPLSQFAVVTFDSENPDPFVDPCSLLGSNDDPNDMPGAPEIFLNCTSVPSAMPSPEGGNGAKKEKLDGVNGGDWSGSESVGGGGMHTGGGADSGRGDGSGGRETIKEITCPSTASDNTAETASQQQTDIIVKYVYEVETVNTSSADSFLPYLEESILMSVADAMMSCLNEDGSIVLEGYEVVGVASSPDDVVMIDGKKNCCTVSLRWYSSMHILTHRLYHRTMHHFIA